MAKVKPELLLIRIIIPFVCAISGGGSAGRRKILVLHLIRSCREMEMKFLVRTLVRNLRIGAMMKTILPALAHAIVLHEKCSTGPVVSLEGVKSQLQNSTFLFEQSLSTEVTEAYNVIPNMDLLVPSLLCEGATFAASSLAMVPGTPIPPMLARITNGVTQALKLFHGRAFTCEYKYDGQRAQIHRLTDGSVQIFSRQMKDSTSRFPDLVNMIKELCNSEVASFILDAEVDICVFVFDIMFCNGQRLLDNPLRQRRSYIHDLFQEKPAYLELAQQLTVEEDEASIDNSSTLHRMSSFFEKACQSSCEGIMLKTLDIDAGYSASKRCDSWLKVKRDYVEGLGDSLDLVPIGAWYGNGRKAGWYSPFLMACYNPESEEFQSVCRVMSGFSDDFYKEMKEFYSGEKILPKKPVYYKTDEQPELWFTAEQVWEIQGADLTLSPVHHAAIGTVHPSRGISVRMPRHIRCVPDRSPEDCSTAADVASMFRAQTRKMEGSTVRVVTKFIVHGE
ncbi:DNA ligase 1 [Triticum urartu]|uniref:DNA ligase n=1 Tax=Triticum urartu TaxID=4572 RepID=M8ARC6_TRIUA|nr:DNA ligase 1 [Triticum urartu]